MTRHDKTKIAQVVADLIKRLDDANPDVGWGMSRQTAVDQALAKLGWNRSDVDYETLVPR